MTDKYSLEIVGFGLTIIHLLILLSCILFSIISNPCKPLKLIKVVRKTFGELGLGEAPDATNVEFLKNQPGTNLHVKVHNFFSFFGFFDVLFAKQTTARWNLLLMGRKCGCQPYS